MVVILIRILKDIFYLEILPKLPKEPGLVKSRPISNKYQFYNFKMEQNKTLYVYFEGRFAIYQKERPACI